MQVTDEKLARLTPRQRELAVTFAFFISDTPVEEWLPALLANIDGRRLYTKVSEHIHYVNFMTWYPAELHERAENMGEVISASDEELYQELSMFEGPDSAYEHFAEAINEVIIDKLREEGKIHPKWHGECGWQAWSSKWHGETLDDGSVGGLLF
jgi:hypothetical protein